MTPLEVEFFEIIKQTKNTCAHIPPSPKPIIVSVSDVRYPRSGNRVPWHSETRKHSINFKRATNRKILIREKSKFKFKEGALKNVT